MLTRPQWFVYAPPAGMWNGGLAGGAHWWDLRTANLKHRYSKCSHTHKQTIYASAKAHRWEFVECNVLERQPEVQWAAPWFLPVLGFIDFILNGWCRCRAETTTLLCWCNILQSNKHQPACQQKQSPLFKGVIFKGGELERPNGWRRRLWANGNSILFMKTLVWRWSRY